MTDLAPHLTTDAQANYQYVDPANISFNHTNDDGTLSIDPANPFGATVTFTIDGGTVTLQLLRTAAQPDTWRVNRVNVRR